MPVWLVFCGMRKLMVKSTQNLEMGSFGQNEPRNGIFWFRWKFGEKGTIFPILSKGDRTSRAQAASSPATG